MQLDSNLFSSRTWTVIRTGSGVFMFLWMKFDPIYKVLIVLMLMDCVAALIRVAIKGGFSVRFLKMGFLLKTGTLLAVGACHVLATYIQVPIGALAGIGFVMIEATSIWKNLQKAGVQFPTGFFSSVKKLQQQRDEALSRMIDNEKKREDK